MDSKLAIATIKESCYQAGYPTHDAEYERRKLINESCDYAIECIEKLNNIEQIINTEIEHGDCILHCNLTRQIEAVLEEKYIGLWPMKQRNY